MNFDRTGISPTEGTVRGRRQRGQCQAPGGLLRRSWPTQKTWATLTRTPNRSHYLGSCTEERVDHRTPMKPSLRWRRSQLSGTSSTQPQHVGKSWKKRSAACTLTRSPLATKPFTSVGCGAKCNGTSHVRTTPPTTADFRLPKTRSKLSKETRGPRDTPAATTDWNTDHDRSRCQL